MISEFSVKVLLTKLLFKKNKCPVKFVPVLGSITETELQTQTNQSGSS